jgi:aminopeptidase N
MIEGDIIARCAQAVDLHGQHLGLWIGDEVGLRLEDLTRQASGVILMVSLDFFAQDMDQGASGLFRREQNGGWDTATQMEPAYARRVFPCFDEPGFKVPWQVTLHVKKPHQAVANSPAIAEVDETDGMKRVRFAETKPMPS